MAESEIAREVLRFTIETAVGGCEGRRALCYGQCIQRVANRIAMVVSRWLWMVGLRRYARGKRIALYWFRQGGFWGRGTTALRTPCTPWSQRSGLPLQDPVLWFWRLPAKTELPPAPTHTPAPKVFRERTVPCPAAKWSETTSFCYYSSLGGSAFKELLIA